MEFKKIVISLPYFFDGEAEAISAMLQCGQFSRVHLRKPGCDEAEMSRLIEGIPGGLRQRLSLHDHFHLAVRYRLGGVHLNSRNPEPPAGWQGMVSRSLHSLDEIGRCEYDYAFLSPVYDSISKTGYRAGFTDSELVGAVDEHIYALGGVTGDKLPHLQQLGFGGAAMLGAAWRCRIDMEAFAFQFISHPSSKMSLEEEVSMVLANGCRWVQLRMKETPESEVAEIAKRIAPLCHRAGAVFILDDHVQLVHSTGADGVHIGKNDMPVVEARRLLGPGKIIGATANTYDDVYEARCHGADYVGVGPFRFTTTKKNLSPVLGLDGYRRIAERCEAEGTRLPIVAIGGITPADIPAILGCGVDGIALSGTILQAVDPAARCREVVGCFAAEV